MALLWADGMGWYDDSASGIDKHYSVYDITSGYITRESSGGRGTTGPCIRGRSSSSGGTLMGCFIRSITPITGGVTKCIAGMRYRSTTASVRTKNIALISFRDTSASWDFHVCVALRTDGYLEVWNKGWSGVGTVLGTSTSALVSDTEYYIEFKANIHNTTGNFEVRVNGTTWISGTNVDTSDGGNQEITAVAFGEHWQWGSDTIYNASTQYWYISDLYIASDAASPNNDFLGEVRVDTIFPDAEGTYNNFTASPAVSHNLNVDDTASDDSSTYNYGVCGSGTKETYSCANMAYTPASIQGVVAHAIVAKNGAGTGNARLVCRSGGSDYYGSSIALGGASLSWQPATYVWDNDPKTSSAWLAANLNSAEFGVEAT